MFSLMLNCWLENTNQTVSQIGMKVNVGGMIEITNDNPITALDFAEGGNESITVRGWAFDPNTPDESVTIHIYMQLIKDLDIIH